MFYRKENKRGFSVVELIIVMGIFSLIAVVSVSSFKGLQTKNAMVIAQESVTNALRRAQTLAISGSHEEGWGVYMETGRITVFQGDDHGTRDASFDKIFIVSEDITFSGLTEVWFSQIAGEPQTTGGIILTQKDNIQTLTLNEYGVINY